MLTQQQLEFRRSYVGASEIAALMGKDKFKTAIHVYNSKVMPPEPQKETPAIVFGNALEPAIISLACRELGVDEESAEKQKEAVSERMLATMDCYTPNHIYRKKDAGPCIIEAKTTGFAGKPIETWGRAGTEDVPDRVLLQAQFQMEVSGNDICWIALLSGHDARGLSLYRIKQMPELGAGLRRIANAFFERFVIPKIEPPPFPTWK